MASITFAVDTTSTTNTNAYTSASFTPVAGDLLVVLVHVSGSTGTASMTDSQVLGFTSVAGPVLSRSSADASYCFISNNFAAASAMTVTFAPSTSSTGAIITVYRVSGMSRTGSVALRQSANQANHAAGTPAPAFSVAALTGNPTLGSITNATSPATMTTASGWTEGSDSGYSTPTTGQETIWRNSGFTGTTVTWGSSSASAFASLIVELDSRTFTAPTVALDNPANTGTVTTTTPELDFTGTDAEGDAVTYRVEVDTVNTFDSQTNSAYATPAKVQDVKGVNNVSATSLVLPAFTNNVVAGNTIILSICSASSSISSVTDNQGNTYHQAVSSGTFSALSTEIWYAYNIGGGNKPAITINFSSSLNFSAIAREYSGLTTTDPIDKTASAHDFTGSSSTLDSGATATTTQSNELVVGAGGDDNITPTAGSGYGNLNTVATSGLQISSIEDKIITTTGTQDATFSLSNGQLWACCVATFKAGLINGPLLDKLSFTDPGFVDITNGAHSDPFPTGEQVGFTIQTGGLLTPVAGTPGSVVVTGFNSGPQTLTFNVNIVGSYPLLVLEAMIWQDVGGTGTITSATFGATPLTQSLASVRSVSMATEQWYLINPIHGVSTMSVTVTGATDAIKLVGTPFYNMAQSSPVDTTNTATGSSGNPSGSITTGVANALVVSSLNRFSTTNATSSLTNLFNDHVASTLASVDYVMQATAGSVTSTYTGTSANDWVIGLVSYKPLTAPNDSLTNGTTYYWRVRGKDPSGTNTFGAWSATRSFTVSVGGVAANSGFFLLM